MTNSEQLAIAALRSRWDSPDRQLILSKLSIEKLQLDDLFAAMKAAKHPFEISDLRGVNFSRWNLSHNFLLFELDLSFSNFSHSQIRGSFQGSVVRGCTFDDAEIIDVHFADANLASSTFERAIVRNAEFAGANLEGVSFQGAQLLNVSFGDVDLTSTRFHNATLGKIKFHKTRLPRASEFWKAFSESAGAVNPEEIVWTDSV